MCSLSILELHSTADKLFRPEISGLTVHLYYGIIDGTKSWVYLGLVFLLNGFAYPNTLLSGFRVLYYEVPIIFRIFLSNEEFRSFLTLNLNIFQIYCILG